MNAKQHFNLLLRIVIAAIIFQKIWLLADRSFLYPDFMFSHIPQTTKSILLYAEIIVGIGALIWVEQTLLILCFFAITRATFHFGSYLQDGGSNLSHLLALLTLPGLLGRYLSAEKEEYLAKTSIFLMRFQIVFVYIAASYSKLSGELWRSGDAVFYILQNDYFSNEFLRSLVIDQPWLSKIAVYSAIVFQVLFPLALVSRYSRYAFLLIGVFFHIGIAFAMNLWVFSFSMIVFYSILLTRDELSFVNAKVLERKK